MYKYKIGDSVLLKGIITDVDTERGEIAPYEIELLNESLTYADEIEIELLSSKTYEDGLKEAWEIARKIENQLGSTILVSIFGSSRIADILDNFSIQEVMEKINDYEATNTIKVGDVVKVQSDSEYVVVATAEEMPNNMYFLRNVENNEKIYFAKEEELEKTEKSMYLEYIGEV